MWRYPLMLALVIAVVVADGVTLVWFFRRLRRIQVERWGKENVKPFRLSFSFRRHPAKG